MMVLHRFLPRVLPISLAAPSILLLAGQPSPQPEGPLESALFDSRSHSSSSSVAARSGWFSMNKKTSIPEIVKAGDPVLQEPAREVDPKEIGSERIQKIIDDMIDVMRKGPGVGLAAPQIGIPLRMIVLEDTAKYISYATKEEIEEQDRRPFDLLCQWGYRAVVDRYLDVEVTGLGRDGKPIKVQASGWQVRILQHDCDHLNGTLYVDKMVPRTFRTVENLELPLADDCPKLGVQ